jgi:hypothetical protein
MIPPALYRHSAPRRHGRAAAHGTSKKKSSPHDIVATTKRTAGGESLSFWQQQRQLQRPNAVAMMMVRFRGRKHENPRQLITEFTGSQLVWQMLLFLLLFPYASQVTVRAPHAVARVMCVTHWANKRQRIWVLPREPACPRRTRARTRQLQ